MKKILYFICCCVIIMAVVGSSYAEVHNEIGGYVIRITNAKAEGNYVILWLDGNHQTLNSSNIENNLIYISQVKALGANFELGGIIPLKFKEASIFVIDESGNTVVSQHVIQPKHSDINKDDIIDKQDLDLLMDYLACCENLTSEEVAIADIDESGFIDAEDARKLLEIIQP